MRMTFLLLVWSDVLVLFRFKSVYDIFVFDKTRQDKARQGKRKRREKDMRKARKRHE